MSIAITRQPSPAITHCELTFVQRSPIDYTRALIEHGAYEKALKKLGLEVKRLPPLPDSPDCVFIEDPAVVFDEFALITRMGTPAREQETESLAKVLSHYRELKYLQAPATLEGGDILKNGKTIYVGVSPRTNHEAVAQLTALTRPHGYKVIPVVIEKCLHLKTACTFLDAETLLANPHWVSVDSFDPGNGHKPRLITCDPTEPFSANTLALEGKILISAGFPKTSDLVKKAGFPVIHLDISELAKAEAGLSCLSLIF